VLRIKTGHQHVHVAAALRTVNRVLIHLLERLDAVGGQNLLGKFGPGGF
jgi:hypothetical protein